MTLAAADSEHVEPGSVAGHVVVRARPTQSRYRPVVKTVRSRGDRLPGVVVLGPGPARWWRQGQHMQVRSLRLLFVSRPLAGHFEPLVPLARAARARGHSVAFATGEPWAARARERGFEAFRAGTDEGFRTEWAPQFPGFADLVGDAQRRFFFGQIFADLELVPRADDLHPIVERWKPDGLVHEVADLSAPLVASAHDLFYADVSFGPLIPLSVLSAAAEAAEPHWRDRGLRPLYDAFWS